MPPRGLRRRPWCRAWRQRDDVRSSTSHFRVMTSLRKRSDCRAATVELFEHSLPTCSGAGCHSLGCARMLVCAPQCVRRIRPRSSNMTTRVWRRCSHLAANGPSGGTASTLSGALLGDPSDPADPHAGERGPLGGNAPKLGTAPRRCGSSGCRCGVGFGRFLV